MAGERLCDAGTVKEGEYLKLWRGPNADMMDEYEVTEVHPYRTTNRVDLVLGPDGEHGILTYPVTKAVHVRGA